MTPLLLVLLGVGIFIGVALGRDSERARRSYKDVVAAKVTVKKGRGIMWSDIRRAVYTFVFVAGALVVALIAGFELPL